MIFKRIFAFLIVTLLSRFHSAWAQAPNLPVSGGTCEGSFVNPISDVCWECLAPITLGSIEVFPSSKYDYGNPALPVCLCGIRPGISIGFWEPRRLMDMTKTPWCFPSIGGVRLDPGIGFDTASRANFQSNDQTSQWHTHYYVYPLLYWLEFAVDVLCAEAGGFDIGYVTELDPIWQNDNLSLIINPEAVIFANPIAITACTADCIGSTAGRSSKEMFWCQGCEGTTYPLTGNVANEQTMAKGAITAAQRMSFKLHRQLIAFTTAGSSNMCAKSPEPLMDKRQYRYQMTYPRAITSGPVTCPNLGFPVSPYDKLGVTAPVKGEDFGILLWGKRNCCAL
ncbi:MAG: TraU family protein [Maricaulaceae bacterium]